MKKANRDSILIAAFNLSTNNCSGLFIHQKILPAL